MRAKTNISTKPVRQITLDDFRGVDFSSSPLRVSTSRATDMQNLICDFGVNHKRNGWRELLRFYDAKNEIGYKINGIFECAADESFLVHAGNFIYRIPKDNMNINEDSKIFTNASDQPSTAFTHYDELYILCGKFMVYRKDGDAYKLQNVDESVAYVPTTTISINKLDENGEPTGTQESLEPTNSLTPKRKNKLVGDKGTEDTPVKYMLDGKIDKSKPVKITLELEEGTIEITVPADTDELKVEKKGTVCVAGSTVSFDFDISPKVQGENNVTVEFYSTPSSIDITKCTFGMKFGADGNTNRLFLGGHPDYPNEDFYSEADNFLYFPPGNKTTFGTDNAPIMAYARLSDKTQVIYKAETPMEATIYYRTGTDKVVNEDGNFVKIETVFPITAGGIGEGVVSRRACASMSGDVLMLSSNGVFGISIGENVATSERYAKERSRSINARLAQHNLKDAVSIVYKNRYYLAVDGVCYIADAKYKYVAEDTVDGAYNYEWWYWTNIPAYSFAEIDDELYFGTADGRLCKFDGEYTDRDNHLASDGDFTIKADKNLCYYNPEGKLHGIADGDTINIDEESEPLHVAFMENCEIKKGRVKISPEAARYIYEGMCVYADNVGRSGLEVNTPYYVTDFSWESCDFALTTVAYDQSKTVWPLRDGFRLSKRVNGTPWLIGNVDTESFMLVSNKDNRIVEDAIIMYNGNAVTVKSANFTHHTNVVAKWVSAVMDLGTNVFSKTLLKLTVAVEPNGAGPITFGYETRLTNAALTAKSMRGFSFDDMDFYDFTFNSIFASSYTARVKERNFNYIVFRFISDSKYSCAVHNLTATYKINKENRGIM